MHLCAPDRFGGGKKSWQRSVYAACVSRAKGMRKQQKKTAISLHLSDRLHTAAAAAAAPAASAAAAAPPASLQVALPCQRRVFAASFHFRSEDQGRTTHGLEMRLRGKRHVFAGSVERQWPRRREEERKGEEEEEKRRYAALCWTKASDRPRRQRPVAGWRDIPFQPTQRIEWSHHVSAGFWMRPPYHHHHHQPTSSDHAIQDPPPQTGCMGSGPADWRRCFGIGYKRAPLKVQDKSCSEIKKKKKN